jgi:hypothetical protein
MLHSLKARTVSYRYGTAFSALAPFEAARHSPRSETTSNLGIGFTRRANKAARARFWELYVLTEVIKAVN